jgi:outer membrane protein assembly factor BamB
MKNVNVGLGILIGMASGIAAATAGDVKAGKTAFENQCAACHTTEAGKNGFGPSLAGVSPQPSILARTLGDGYTQLTQRPERSDGDDSGPVPLVAGVTATAGGVLFTGDVGNNFLAFDARTGKTLYSFNTGGSVAGGIISYDIGGKQYVAAASGLISGWFGGTGTTAVVIFALR